ncbi:MAG: hypothetical protein M3Y34_05435, partial [Actinomycetota bacterium]|nr:hypothetical protein [Actinomycetota bacterium]
GAPMSSQLIRVNAIAISCAFLVAGCGADGDGTRLASDPSAGLPQGSEPVELDPAEFTTRVDNPYLPLAPGSRWVYAETEAGEPDQKVVVEVTGETKKIANGVEALVVRDVVTQGGEPIEITDDWYAQDSEGNVWYLGEDTAEYEDGKRVCRCGSFEAGVDGAEPGIVMPAGPEVGMSYRQEYLKGEAEDEGKVLSLDEMAQAPAGFYPETLMTRDTNPLEPKVSEHKFYAEGIGLVLALHVSGGQGREQLISYTPGG